MSGAAPAPEARLVVRELRGLDTGWWEWPRPGRPLLFFLHGFPDSPDTWEFQVRHFSSRFHVVCPFGRGAGPSEPSRRSRYNERAVALDLLQIRAAVDPKLNRPVWLVGHDLGAVAAWNLAPLLGDKLRGVVIVNGLSLVQMLGRARNPRQHLRSWYIYLMQLPVLPEFLATRFPRTLLNVAFGLGGLPRELRPEPGDPDRTLEQYRALARELPALRRRPRRRLGKPVLVLWGARDPFLLPPRLEELQPDASRLVTRILDGGHWVHREKAAEVNRILEEFFAEVGG